MGLRDRLLAKAASDSLIDADPAVVRDYYQSVLDSVGSVIYTVNRDLRITGVNQQWDDFALLNGGEHLVRDRILGSYLLDQMGGAPLDRWRTVCLQILDGQIPRYLDEIVSEESYAWRYFSLAAHPLCDSQGQILGITFVATNITQLKKAEYEMYRRLIEVRGLRQVAHTAGAWVDRRKVYKQVTADIAHLFSATKCVIFLWDEHSGNLKAQEPAYGLAGRKLASLSLDMGHPADPDSLWTDLEERDYILLNEGDEAPADMVETFAQVDQLAAMMGILRVSGRVHGAILVAGRDRSFTNQDGQLLALFAIPMALSIENTNLNRSLLDRAQRLTTTQDDLNRMIKLNEAIRAPLSVVRGYMELLVDGVLGPVPEEMVAAVHLVSDKTRTVAAIVDQTLAPQFVEGANRYENILLSNLVHKVLEKRAIAIQQAGLTLIAQLPALLDEDSMTVGDQDLLFMVFDALLDNAIKFTASGGTVRVSLHTSGEIIYVKLADSGVGISLDQLLQIWEPKRRAADVEPISLAEVKRIVEGHGGQVWAESEPGQGSAFYVALRRLEH